MKHLLLPGMCVVLVTAVACQHDNSIETAQLDKIAADELYFKYQAMATQHASNLLGDVYDKDGIYDLSEAQRKAICALSDSLLQEIRGGLQYRDFHCGMFELWGQLAIKYPGVNKLPDEDLRYIKDKYRAMTSDADLNRLREEFIKKRGYEYE